MTIDAPAEARIAGVMASELRVVSATGAGACVQLLRRAYLAFGSVGLLPSALVTFMMPYFVVAIFKCFGRVDKRISRWSGFEVTILSEAGCKLQTRGDQVECLWPSSITSYIGELKARKPRLKGALGCRLGGRAAGLPPR